MSNEKINRIFKVFHSVSWFSDVGKPLTIESEFTRRIEPCSSWDQAVEEVSKETWLDLKSDAMNNLSFFRSKLPKGISKLEPSIK